MVSVVIVFIKMFSQLDSIIWIYIIIVLLADVVIYVIAPLGNRNRILDQEEIQIYKKQICIYLFIENTLVTMLVGIGQKIYAIAIVLAIGCEAVLLLLEKMQKNI